MGLDHVLHQRDQILRQYIVPLAPSCDSDKLARRVVVGVRYSANNRPPAIFIRPVENRGGKMEISRFVCQRIGTRRRRLLFPEIEERVHLNVVGLISSGREEKRHLPVQRQVACLQDKS